MACPPRDAARIRGQVDEGDPPPRARAMAGDDLEDRAARRIPGQPGRGDHAGLASVWVLVDGVERGAERSGVADWERIAGLRRQPPDVRSPPAVLEERAHRVPEMVDIRHPAGVCRMGGAQVCDRTERPLVVEDGRDQHGPVERSGGRVAEERRGGRGDAVDRARQRHLFDVRPRAEIHDRSLLSAARSPRQSGDALLTPMGRQGREPQRLRGTMGARGRTRRAAGRHRRRQSDQMRPAQPGDPR